MFQNFPAFIFFNGFNNGMAHSTNIPRPRMQINFKSNRSPIIMDEPEKALPGGLKLKKKINRINVIKARKIPITERIQPANLGPRFNSDIEIFI